jgi:hypothetical protein
VLRQDNSPLTPQQRQKDRNTLVRRLASIKSPVALKRARPHTNRVTNLERLPRKLDSAILFALTDGIKGTIWHVRRTLPAHQYGGHPNSPSHPIPALLLRQPDKTISWK